jgi:hypothetical protein
MPVPRRTMRRGPCAWLVPGCAILFLLLTRHIFVAAPDTFGSGTRLLYAHFGCFMEIKAHFRLGFRGPNSYEPIWTHLKQIESLSWTLPWTLACHLGSPNHELSFLGVWINWMFFFLLSLLLHVRALSSKLTSLSGFPSLSHMLLAIGGGRGFGTWFDSFAPFLLDALPLFGLGSWSKIHGSNLWLSSNRIALGPWTWDPRLKWPALTKDYTPKTSIIILHWPKCVWASPIIFFGKKIMWIMLRADNEKKKCSNYFCTACI